MSRLILIMMTLVLILSLCACAEYKKDETVPTDAPGISEDPAGETMDLNILSTVETTEPDPMAAYVETARQEVLIFSNADGLPMEQTYRYPAVRLSGDDAEIWNDRLARDMDIIFDEVEADARNGAGAMYSSVDYEAWLCNDFLIVIITMSFTEVENAEHRVGVFDLQTEEELDKGELFCLVTGQRTPASMNEVIALCLGDWFDQEHQSLEQDTFLLEQREKTVSPENVEQAWLYFDEAGELMAIVPAYTVAGTLMTTAIFPLTDFSPVEVSTPPAEDATLDQLVTVYRSEHVVYTDSVGNAYDISMTIPQVNIDTPAGRDCNWELRDKLEICMDEQIEAKEGGWSTHTGSIGYDAWIWENTLTLMAWNYSTVEWNDYYVYVFDMETGEQLTNQAVAELWSWNGKTWEETAADAMELFYREKYAYVSDNMDETHQEQLERTISEENVFDSVLYPSANGTPMVLCKIYSLAGAEYYWHLVPMTLT